MKRLLVLVAVAFGAVALYAVTAPAGQQAVTPAQITAINKKITALQKQVKALNAKVTCVTYKFVPVTEYGGAPNVGFLYQQPDGSVTPTSALDITDQGGTPDIVLSTTDPACLTAAKFTPRGAGRSAAR